MDLEIAMNSIVYFVWGCMFTAFIFSIFLVRLDARLYEEERANDRAESKVAALEKEIAELRAAMPLLEGRTMMKRAERKEKR